MGVWCLMMIRVVLVEIIVCLIFVCILCIFFGLRFVVGLLSSSSFGCIVSMLVSMRCCFCLLERVFVGCCSGILRLMVLSVFVIWLGILVVGILRFL